MNLSVVNRVFLFPLFIMMILSCAGNPDTADISLPEAVHEYQTSVENVENAENIAPVPVTPPVVPPVIPPAQQHSVHPVAQPSAGGLADEIRHLTETGVLSSMLRAIEIIRARDLGSSEFGRLMSGISATLIRLIYPDSPTRLPVVDLPQISGYTRIIREAERGNYTRPSLDSTDFLEHVLPFLAVVNQDDDISISVLRDLEKAARLQPSSIIPLYFSGIFYQRAGRNSEAIASYEQAYNKSNECYPAQINIARIRRLSGDTAAAISILAGLVVRYPDSMTVKRELAIAYYSQRDWSRALPAVDEILRSEPRDGQFLLLRASILIEQGQYTQANASLDTYASINANDRDYLYMRARVQFEGNRSRDSALNYLRSILRTSPNDVQALVYTVTLLMESQRQADQTEGRELLTRLRQLAGSAIEVLNLSLRDAVRRENWREAQGYVNQVLQTRRTNQDLTDAFNIERGLGNNARALAYAQELYQKDTANTEFTGIYVSALIDNGRRDEASTLLEARINSVPSGVIKGHYFYLRSRLQTNEDTALGDLRSSLFEDPRNLDAIIAMFMIYHNRREERRAVYYLRQALAISPDNPRLTRYVTEYASLLGRS